MLINCDLGESYGDRIVGDDALIMPYIDQANIACGFHGGDHATISTTLQLAIRHGVAIGAHPSYPDLEGFGRRSMTLSPEALTAALHYQIGALEAMALCAGTRLAHVKPHGALYNDMMKDDAVRLCVLNAIASYHNPLPLVIQATPERDRHLKEAQKLNVALRFEAFADRRYEPDGTLTPRDSAGAVLAGDAMLAQVQQLQRLGSVQCADGSTLAVQADTLCLHGDNATAVEYAPAVRKILQGG